MGISPRTVLAAVLVLVLCAMGPVSAADLGDRTYEGVHDRSPYDDPRYRYMYRRSAPSDPGSRYDRREYQPPRRAPYPDYNYGRPGQGYDRPGRFQSVCMDRYQISRHLRTQGWRVLEWYEFTRRTATFEAQRISDGRPYDVSVDRCSGRLLAVDPQRGRYDDYVWRQRVYNRRY